MTTKEKIKAIQAECHKFEDCDECPYTNSGWCDIFNSDTASPKVIDAWYAHFFEGGEPYVFRKAVQNERPDKH